MKKKIIAGILAGIISISSVALAENEATFDVGTGVLNIPKVDVSSVYYNVDMQQQGPGLNFSVSMAMASDSSSSENVAIYNPNTGDLNIPTVIVGTASYTVDMAQGEGLSFSVNGATVIISTPTLLYPENGEIVDTWIHPASSDSNEQELIFNNDNTWSNYDTDFGSCIEGGTYTNTDTIISFTFDSNGGCLMGEGANSTMTVNYTINSSTLSIDFGDKVTEYSRQ